MVSRELGVIEVYGSFNNEGREAASGVRLWASGSRTPGVGWYDTASARLSLRLRGGAGAGSGVGSPKFVVELNALKSTIDNRFQFVRVFHFAALG